MRTLISNFTNWLKALKDKFDRNNRDDFDNNPFLVF
jgi:hypothetical protein